MNKSTFKNHQKWTALLVVSTFAWLLQVLGHAPGRSWSDGAGRHRQAPEQATGFVEQEGPEWNYARKKSYKRIIIWCLIGFAIYAVIVALTRGFNL